MRKINFLLVVLLWVGSLFSPLSAQTPLTEGGGPAIENCNAYNSTPFLLRNDDKTAVFYLDTYSTNPKSQYQGLVTYNKTTQTAFKEDVVLPAGYRHLYSRAAGSDYLAYYYRYNAETHNFDYAVARFPQKKAVEGVRNITPEIRTSIDLTGRGEILKYTAVSPDASKYAVTFIVPNDRNQAPYFYCYIYDSNGEEIWYDKFLPSISGSKFSIQDIGLSDKGELLLLVYATKGKGNVQNTPTVQLFSCTKGNITSISEELTFGYVNSMKMLRLKNNDIFIGGYYDDTPQSNTTGCFNFIISDQPLKITAKNHAAFNYTNEVVYDGLNDQDYFVKCDYLYELPDKIVVMLGEQYASLMQNEKSTTYRYHTNFIYCNKFTLGGTDLGLVKVQKHQTTRTASLLTSHDDGERIGSYLFEAKKVMEKSPTFTAVGLHYYPIVRGNMIYILYMDKFSNFAEDATGWEGTDMEKNEENCVVLTKVDYSTDKKVVTLPNKNGQHFHDVWLVDGENIYFGMSGKKNYTLEKFLLNNKWNWDK
ncbi:MAG: hypothetical protein J5642_02965 [Bacteroidales bacterium]|nr:hypothetical protein [Bacteroidales bacterium]